MDALDGALERLFQVHGYKTTRAAALEGRSGAVYGAPVLAETAVRVLLVERSTPDKPITPDAVQELRRVVEDTGAHLGVLVALGPVEDDAASAGQGRVCIWDRATVARLLGEATLHDAAGTPVEALPLRTGGPVAQSSEERLPGSLADMLPSAFQQDATDEVPVFGDEGAPQRPTPDPASAPGPATQAPSPEPTGPFDLDAFESLTDGSGSEEPAPDFGLPFDMGLGGTDDDAPRDTPFPSPEPPAETPDALAPRIDPQQAARSVEGRLFAVDKAELVLQPVHLFDFQCDLLVEGSLQYDTVEGRLEVHGTTKAVQDVDPLHLDPAKVRPLPADLADGAEEKTLRVPPDTAQQRVREHLLETHTRVVEIETGDPDEDYSITERKKVAPRPDQIRIDPLGIVLRPVWRLRGPNGAMLVDAVDGHVVEETLKSPDPDIIMMD